MRAHVLPLLLFGSAVVQAPAQLLAGRNDSVLAQVIVFVLGVGGYTGAIYYLGRFGERGTSTTQFVSTELTRVRAEMTTGFAAAEVRWRTFDAFVASFADHRATTERWHGRIDTTLDMHARRLDTLEADRDREYYRAQVAG